MNGADPRPLVSVVCPVYNEERAIPLFYERLLKALKPSEEKVRFEFVFMNNRSTDRTLEILRELQAKDPRVQYITFSRNFGYQASITAGMRHARGDAIVNIDVDCEDPPEMIPRFIDRWLAGADVAYGIRDKREEFILMHLARKMFYRVTRRVADHDIVLDMAEFFLVDKRVRDHVLATHSTFPFVRGQVGYVGFKREGIPYKREKRIIGETHYNLVSAIRFGVAGILTTSTWVLRLLTYVGVLGFALDIAAIVAVAGFGGHWGLTGAERALWSVALFHFAWIIVGIGTLAMYLARVYKDTIGLPLYVVDEKLTSFARSDDAAY